MKAADRHRPQARSRHAGSGDKRDASQTGCPFDQNRSSCSAAARRSTSSRASARTMATDHVCRRVTVARRSCKTWQLMRSSSDCSRALFRPALAILWSGVSRTRKNRHE